MGSIVFHGVTAPGKRNELLISRKQLLSVNKKNVGVYMCVEYYSTSFFLSHYNILVILKLFTLIFNLELNYLCV